MPSQPTASSYAPLKPAMANKAISQHVKLRGFSLLTPDEICHANLDVAYYPGPGEQVTPIRGAFWHLQQEGQIKWKMRVIEGTDHLAALMVGWKPDILITHWHGECTSHPKRSVPGDIAHRLRERRGDFCGSNGPFLVAQISAGDSRFQYEPEEGLRLIEIYDMVIQRPSSFEKFPKNIATGIYNAAHPDAPLQFDMDFPVLTFGTSS
jgi:hypothetical protein